VRHSPFLHHALSSDIHRHFLPDRRVQSNQLPPNHFSFFELEFSGPLSLSHSLTPVSALLRLDPPFFMSLEHDVLLGPRPLPAPALLTGPLFLFPYSSRGSSAFLPTAFRFNRLLPFPEVSQSPVLSRCCRRGNWALRSDYARDDDCSFVLSFPLPFSNISAILPIRLLCSRALQTLISLTFPLLFSAPLLTSTFPGSRFQFPPGRRYQGCLRFASLPTPADLLL